MFTNTRLCVLILLKIKGIDSIMSCVIELMSSMQQISSIDDLNTLMSGFFDNIGFDKYAYVLVNHPTDSKLNNSYVSNFPLQWEARYTEKDYFKVDPLYQLFQEQKKSFAWGFELQRDNLSTTQKKFFLEANDFGVDKGIGVPIFSPNGGFSIVSLCSKYLHGKEMEKYLQEKQKDLMIASLLHHQATLALKTETKRYQDFGLDERELDTLYWLCMGKTKEEIAMILGIKREGISERLRKIYRKMNVHSSVSAVVKSITSGTIVLRELILLLVLLLEKNVI